MRQAFPADTLDQLPIADLPIPTHGRPELCLLLAGLQHLYRQTDLRDELLRLVAADVNATTSAARGRPGLDYWQLLVLAAVRLGCNLDYDQLQDLAEQHYLLRRMMGIGTWEDSTPQPWDWRRIADNVRRIAPATLTRLNDLVVQAGHRVAPAAPVAVRGDTFVIETNIHHPTDVTVLGDGLRKVLTAAMVLAGLLGRPGWRQGEHLLKRIKQWVRAIGQACKSKRKGAAARRRAAYQPLLKQARKLLRRARALEESAAQRLSDTTLSLEVQGQVTVALRELTQYRERTEKAEAQARRRVVQGEPIPSGEKLLSVFEPHTEVICKGKARTPVQFGRQVLTLEDTEGFIVHDEVLRRGQKDRDVGIAAVETAQKKLDGKIERASFDRGFHTPENQKKLAALVPEPCLPMRGPKQGPAQAAAATDTFRRSRRRHPGVESLIHALQAGNGLERCRDRTAKGLERYVGLAVLGRNLHVLGRLVLARSGATGPATASRRQAVA